MALTDSLPTSDPGGLTVADERLILSGLIAKNADGTPRVGVFPAGTAPLVTGRASMAYDIAPFKAATSRTGTGVELLANDALTTVATTAAPGANSRIDVIWVRPQFTTNADPSNVPVFGVTQGSAAGIPSKPAIPAGALELATAEILSTTTTTSTAVITQTAPLTAAAGGIVPVRNATELAAFVASDGTLARDLMSNTIHQRVAGAWSVLLRPLAPYAATITGLTLAQVSVSTKHQQLGKMVHVEVEITRTAAGLPTGTVSISLPVPVANTAMTRNFGVGLFALQGGAQYDVRARYTGGNTVVVNFPGVAGSALASGSNLAATFPTSANHGVGTTLHLTFEYEGA